MRLIHLADYGGPYGGSFVPMLRAVLGMARERGWQAEAVFGHAARGRPWLAELEAEEIAVRFVAPRPRGRAREELAALFDGHDGRTIVHTHFTGFDIPALQAAKASRGDLVYWHNHMGSSSKLETRARNVVKYTTLGRRVERILCVAPDAAEAARSRGAPRERVLFLPNAIDTERFPPVSAEARRLSRAELGLADDEHALLHFGWDWHRKGGDLLVAATRELRGGGLPAVALSVGAGENIDAESAGGGGAAVRALEPRERVQDLFAAADAFVSCSRAEGMTYSVAEALCCGVPVVASRIPGQEWIAPGLAARRLTALDPPEIAREIRHLLEREPRVAREDAAAAREWVIEHMDISSWAKSLMTLYVDGLAGPRSG